MKKTTAQVLETMFKVLVPSARICTFAYRKEKRFGKYRGWWVTFTFNTPDGNFIARSRFIGRNQKEAAKRLAVAYARTQRQTLREMFNNA